MVRSGLVPEMRIRGVDLQPLRSNTPSFTTAFTCHVLSARAACGVLNQSGLTMVVSNSFWGAASGPGGAPANGVCNDYGSTTVVPSVAPEAFRISVGP